MKIRYIITILTAGLLTTACSEDVLKQDNPNEFTVAQYYKDAGQLKTATNGVYGLFYGADLWGRMFQYFSDMRADEHAAGGTQIESHNAQLLNGSYDNTGYPIQGVWRGLYRMIHRANAVIEYGPKSEGIDEGTLKQCLAEAKFLRAYAYYYLVVNWGRIPIYTETAKTLTDWQPLSEESAVYQLIEADLNEIIGVLPVSYKGNDLGRATKGAAQLLLARTLMHQGKYAEAHPVLLAIYDSKNDKGEKIYKLMDNYSDNFREEAEFNAESIFEIGFMGTGFTWNGTGENINARSTIMFQDYNPVGWRNAIPSDKYLNEFERPSKGDPKEDPRLRESVYFTGDFYGDPDPTKRDTLFDSKQNGFSSTFDGVTIKTGWKKYSPMYKVDPGGYYQSNINYRNMRFAEVLIKLAECENEVGTPENAIDYLNEIRRRASVLMEEYPTANYPCNSKEQIYRAIMHENTVEFGNEKLRVLELARWRKNGKFSALNPDPIGYIASDPSKALLPLPQEEAGRNASIK